MISTQDVDSLPGTPVVDVDGDKVGDVAQVYVSDDGARPLFVTVKTGLFGTKESFVPLDEATLVSGALRVGYDKAVIKDAPRVEADDHLSDEEQDSLFDYYEQHAGTGRGTGGRLDDAGDAAGTTPAGIDYGGADRTDVDPVGAGIAGSGATTGGPGLADATGAEGRVDDLATTDARAVDGAAGAEPRVDRSADQGHDVSGPTTDDAMTLSEEQLRVGVQQVETGRARLRKHVVTEQRTVTVPVTHDEVRIEREPITDANIGAATDGPELSEEEHEVVLTEERPVVDTEVVPVERVRLAKEQVTEQRDVTADVRHEEVDTTGLGGATGAATGTDAGRADARADGSIDGATDR